jgi:hypothetical protein
MQVRELHMALAGAGEAARSRVMVAFKAAGGSLDQWNRATWLTMATAITSVEDELESEGRGHMTAPRTALRALRRRLEDAVDLDAKYTRPAAVAA